jgi:hypothetical protein
MTLNAGWYVTKKGKRKFFARYRYTVGGVTQQHPQSYFAMARKLAEIERGKQGKRVCENCTKLFEPKHNKAHFCSQRCRTQACRARRCTDNPSTAGGRIQVSEANVT